MVKIRLSRHGAKKTPYYHVVVANSESARNGRFLEQIGTYDPSRPDAEIRVRTDRLEYWLGVGAVPTERARRVINDYKRAAAAAAPTTEA